MNHFLTITLTDEQEKKLAQAFSVHPERIRQVPDRPVDPAKPLEVIPTHQEGNMADSEVLLLRWARHTPVMELERVELSDLIVIKAKLTTATDKEIADVKAALKIAAVVAEEPGEPVK